MGIRYFEPVQPEDWTALKEAMYSGNLSLFDYGLLFRDLHMHRARRPYTEHDCMQCIVGHAATNLVGGALYEARKMFGREVMDYDMIDELSDEFWMLVDWQSDHRRNDETL